MRQTLWIIPREIYGLPVFGMGWFLGLWILVGIVVLAWQFRRHGWSAETRSFLTLLVVGVPAIVFFLPVIGNEAGLPIRGYGVMLLVAVFASIALAMLRARRYGIDPDLMLSLATWLLPAGIVGARVFYIVEYWEEKFRQPTFGETIVAMLKVTEGGLVVYGCMIAGAVALIAFIYRYRLPGLALTDLIAPSVVLGMGLGRVGCFLNGCCFGGQCDLPWAVSFPWNSPPHIAQVERGTLFLHGLQFGNELNAPPVIQRVEPGSAAERAGLQAGQRIAAINDVHVKTVGAAEFVLLQTFGEGATLSIALADGSAAKHWQIAGPPPRSLPVHPTQLYSAIDALLLCFFLLAYDPYHRRDGELAAIVLTIHPITRFLIEVIRVDEADVFQTGMSISQNISLAIFLGGLVLWAYIFVRPQRLAWPRAVMAAS